MSISGSRWSLKNSFINNEWFNTQFIHTGELVPNVFAIKVRQYQIRNRLTQRTSDQCRSPGAITLPRQKILLIIFRRLFSVRYIGTFPQSVNNWHHITLLEMHIHLPFPLGPVCLTTSLSTFILESDAIFSCITNIKLHTMNWIWNTLTFTTYDFSSCDNSRRK